MTWHPSRWLSHLSGRYYLVLICMTVGWITFHMEGCRPRCCCCNILKLHHGKLNGTSSVDPSVERSTAISAVIDTPISPTPNRVVGLVSHADIQLRPLTDSCMRECLRHEDRQQDARFDVDFMGGPGTGTEKNAFS